MSDSVATAAGQGAPAAGAQPAAAGAGQGAAQGQPTAGSQGDGQFNWGLYPDVPVDQRELLQPHLQKAQGYTTQLEMQYAPYKGLTGLVQPDQVENLVGFLNGYNSDSAGTVLGMLQQEVEAGNITPEQLAQVTGQQAQAPQGQAQPEAGQEQVPAWAQQLQQRLDAQDAQTAQEAEAAQEAELAQVMETAKTNIRGQLTQGGITDGLVTDEMIVAAVIANNGDEQAAANSFVALRNGFLGEFTNGKTAGAKAPNVQGELPATPKPGGNRRGDSFAAAKTGAKQFLEQQANMAA